MNNLATRPSSGEAVDYYFKYINAVPDGDIVTTLDQQRHDTNALLQSIPESRAGYRYEPGKWSIKELVGHVNDSERLFASRALWFARSLGGSLPSFDQEIAVKAAGSDACTLAALTQEFDAIRGATISLFRNFSDEAWSREGIASDYRFTVRALAWIIAGHVVHHSRVLSEKYGPLSS